MKYLKEYWVSHIKKDDKHIKQVKAFLNTVEGIKNPVLFNRDEIVKSIDKENDQWYTCVLKNKKEGKRIWQKGSKIHTINVDGNKYIRTDRNKKDSDNLGELPSLEDNGAVY